MVFILKKLSKIFSLIIAGVSLLFGLTACGDKEIDPNNTTEYANIKYEWSWFDYKYDDATEKYIAVEI